MKSIFNFLFAYGHLGWKGRLSRPDHLYHQGRNILAMLLLMLLVAVSLFVAMGLNFIPSGNSVWMLSLPFVLMFGVGMLYLAFNAIRLTVLRLHDFNLSGWWILSVAPLIVIDVLADMLLPNVSSFISLQNLAYLAVLVLPGQAADNRFGPAGTYATAGKSRVILALPLIFFVVSWVSGMLGAFTSQFVAHPVAESQQATIQMEQHLDEYRKALEESDELMRHVETMRNASPIQSVSSTEIQEKE